MPSAQAEHLRNLLRESIVQLCKVGITFRGQVEVDAILCIASEVEEHEVVVKIHEKFTKVPLTEPKTSTPQDIVTQKEVPDFLETVTNEKADKLTNIISGISHSQDAQSSENDQEPSNTALDAEPSHAGINEDGGLITQTKTVQLGMSSFFDIRPASDKRAALSMPLKSSPSDISTSAPSDRTVVIIPEDTGPAKVSDQETSTVQNDPKDVAIPSTSYTVGKNFLNSLLGSSDLMKSVLFGTSKPSQSDGTTQVNAEGSKADSAMSSEPHTSNPERNNPDVEMRDTNRQSPTKSKVLGGAFPSISGYKLGVFQNEKQSSGHGFSSFTKNPKYGFSQMTKQKSLRGSAAVPISPGIVQASIQAMKDAKQKICCEICNVTLVSEMDFIEHNEKEHKRLICPHCHRLYKGRSELEEHVTQHDSHVCLVCDIAFQTNKELEIHLYEEHINRSKETGNFDLHRCSECNATCPSLQSLKSHFNSEHDLELQFSCGPCFKGFGNVDQFAHHRLREHSTVTDLPCPDCDFVALSKLNFVKHLSHHECPTCYHCTYCDKEYGDPLKYSQHILTEHLLSDNLLLDCTLCQQKCGTIEEWQKHEAAHVELHTYTCVQCSVHLKTVSELRCHVAVHDNTINEKVSSDSSIQKNKELDGHSNQANSEHSGRDTSLDNSFSEFSYSEEEALNLTAKPQHKERNDVLLNSGVELDDESTEILTPARTDTSDGGRTWHREDISETGAESVNAKIKQTLMQSTCTISSAEPSASTQRDILIHLPVNDVIHKPLSIKIPISDLSQVVPPGTSSWDGLTNRNNAIEPIEIKDSPNSDSSTTQSGLPAAIMVKPGISRKSSLEPEMKRLRPSGDERDGKFPNHEIPQLFNCPICHQFECTGYTDYESHVMAAHGRLTCKYCSKLFGNKANRERHMNLHTGETPFKCPECGQGFIRGDTMRFHRIKAHNLTVEETYTYTKYAQHIKGFAETVASTSNHGNNTRDGAFSQMMKLFSCNMPAQGDGETFESSSAYSRIPMDVGMAKTASPQLELPSTSRENPGSISHLQESEAEGIPIEIQPRDDDDSSSTGLGEQDQAYFGFNPDRVFHCEMCQEDMLGWETFDNHTMLHRRFPCPYCGKLYTQKGNRERHMRLHTGERPYKCPYCPLRYRRKENLSHHVDKQHHL